MISVGTVRADTITVSVPERSPEIEFALERLGRVLADRQISMTVSSGPNGDISLHCAGNPDPDCNDGVRLLRAWKLADQLEVDSLEAVRLVDATAAGSEGHRHREQGLELNKIHCCFFAQRNQSHNEHEPMNNRSILIHHQRITSRGAAESANDPKQNADPLPQEVLHLLVSRQVFAGHLTHMAQLAAAPGPVMSGLPRAVFRPV
jgi:hypothetical protein